jgi:non-specific protein-tyrosine kinase
LNEDTQTTVSLRHYLDVLWRRKWIIVLTMVLVTLIVVGASLLQPTRYAGTARVIAVQQSPALNVATSLDVGSLTLDERGLTTLASFVVTPDMATRAGEQLERVGDTDALLESVTAEADTTTDIILVRALAAEPTEAADVANAFAEQFVAWRREIQQTSLDEAIATIDEEIEVTETNTLRRQLLLDQRSQLEVLKTLLNGDVQIGESARPSSVPASPKPVRNGALALAGGLMLGIGLAFVREALDIKLRSVDAIAESTSIPFIGAIPSLSKEQRTGDSLVVLDDPRGAVAEAFRFLRTNLEFVNFNRDVKTILITSPEPSQGKSTTIANLAIALLRSGKRVAVIGADLRRPALHRFFKIANSRGVTTVVSGGSTLEDAVQVLSFGDHSRMVTAAVERTAKPLQQPDVPEQPGGELQLTVLPSGPLPPNPGEIVTSKQLTEVLQKLQATHDYVLVDAPPMFAVGDAAAMADKVDGVLAVLRLDQTTRDTLREVEMFLSRVPSRTLGIVVTGVPRSSKSKYYRYEDYYE